MSTFSEQNITEQNRTEQNRTEQSRMNSAWVKKSLNLSKPKFKKSLVFNFEHKYQEAMDDMTKWLQEGKIKYKEDINIGFDNIPLNFMKLFDSENFGKLLVDIKS